jgi:hypothetical protein
MRLAAKVTPHNAIDTVVLTQSVPIPLNSSFATSAPSVSFPFLELFREAFSGVTPARNGRPSPGEARRNKAILMKALGPHGITSERLDEVSDYYRYQPQRGQPWKNVPAKAYAIVENGKVKKVVVTSPGSGYNTPPTAIVRGMEMVALKVTVQFGKELDKNGSVRAVEIETPATGR